MSYATDERYQGCPVADENGIKEHIQNDSTFMLLMDADRRHIQCAWKILTTTMVLTFLLRCDAAGMSHAATKHAEPGWPCASWPCTSGDYADYAMCLALGTVSSRRLVRGTSLNATKVHASSISNISKIPAKIIGAGRRTLSRHTAALNASNICSLFM